MIIDFHSHVLPGIDDGSPHIQETKALLTEEMNQGVDFVIGTPHFYAAQESIAHFVEKREHAYHHVQALLDKHPELPKVSYGAEVYYFPGMARAEELMDLCYKGTDILLLEMPFAQWQSGVAKDVKELIEKRKLTIILAHIERFYPFQKDKSVWNEVFSMPIIPQTNTGCLEEWKNRHFIYKFMKENDDILLGTDCHNMKRRPPNMETGRARIAKKFGDERLEDIDNFGLKVLRDHGFEI